MTGPESSCPSLFRLEKSRRCFPGGSPAVLKLIGSLNSTSPYRLLVNWACPTCINACPQMVISFRQYCAVLYCYSRSPLSSIQRALHNFIKRVPAYSCRIPSLCSPSGAGPGHTPTHICSLSHTHTHIDLHTPSAELECIALSLCRPLLWVSPTNHP